MFMKLDFIDTNIKRSRFREITGHDDVKSHPAYRYPS